MDKASLIKAISENYDKLEEINEEIKELQAEHLELANKINKLLAQRNELKVEAIKLTRNEINKI